MTEAVRSIGVRGVLRNRLGRRLLGLLLGCALLPLVSFAWLSANQVSSHLQAEAEMGLHLSAKSVGMGIAGRLAALKAEFELAREELHRAGPGALHRSHDSLARHVGRLFRSVWVWDGHDARHEFGEAPQSIRAPAQAEAEHLAAGKTLVKVQPSGAADRPATVLLLHRLPDMGDLLVGEVLESELWNAEELRSNGAEVVILGQDLGVLFSTVEPLPDLGFVRSALTASPSSGTLEWQLGGHAHLARYWRMFLKPQLGADWLVIQSRAAESVLAPLHGFQRWLGLTGLLSCLVVLFASLIQIRRTLGPIEALQAGTHRVAAGDYSTPVPVLSKDELGDLGRSFNAMVGDLVSNIQRREQSEKALVAARDAMVASAKAKADFLTNVSHELRTPLTTILSSAEILQSYADEDRAVRAEFIRGIVENAGRLHELVDKVLELTGGGEWVLEDTDIVPTLQCAIGGLPPARRARVALVLAADVPRVACAPARLANLWNHLLDNALRFSPEDSKVTVRARGRGRHCLVEVQDHGVGIAPADVERIFEPFCQVGVDLMTGKVGGTGLGLTLARHIAARHGGRIEVEAQPGKGSVFRVVLPALEGAVAAPALAGAAS